MKLYVGNLPYEATEDELKERFEKCGSVVEAIIIRDRDTGRSKGYGFVTMQNQEDGERAIAALDGQKMMRRPLKVNPARPREERHQPRRTKPPTNQTQRTHEQHKSSPNDYFHNPYTFVPTPPRDKITTGEFAGDFNPLCKDLNHATLQDGLWTGHIPIKLTTVTPLVLLKNNGQREETSEEPYDVHSRIPESSLRGMLRSAYETVTNSRYSCFRNDEKLKYRMGREKRTYEKSPAELLDCSLKPATKLSELSPADRLFGWTPQEKRSDSGYKSRLRIICDHVEPNDPLNAFQDDPLPLAILGEPKPEQGRFYVAKDNKGTSQDDGLNKEDAGYSSGKGLRGRKHFWHHKNLGQDYWNPKGKKRTREYIRTGRKKDSQNRSINAWINPGTTFTASLYVQNLQPAEVGALLWLLTRPDDQYFRLGYGKPLGFGSVKIEIDTECLPLGTGKDWKEYYVALNDCPPAKLDTSEREKCIQEFKDSMKQAYQERDFDKLPFIEGFLQVLKGPNTDNPRIHYPRKNRIPHPDGKNFEWFVDNDHQGYGKKLALPKVTAKKGLPYKAKD